MAEAMPNKQARIPWWKYAVAGILAGTANGFFGSGGGLFLVPLFTGWLHMEQRHAFATSVAVILPLSAVSFVVYLLKGGVDMTLALPYLIGGAAGGLLAGMLFRRLSMTVMRRIMGALILYGGIRAVLLL